LKNSLEPPQSTFWLVTFSPKSSLKYGIICAQAHCQTNSTAAFSISSSLPYSLACPVVQNLGLWIKAFLPKYCPTYLGIYKYAL